MTTANPYAGTDHESDWAYGYQYGQQNPADANPIAPVPYDPSSDAAQVWCEGALAGQHDVQVNPVTYPPPEEHNPFVEPVTVYTAEKITEIVEHGVSKVSWWPNPIVVFVELILAEEPPPELATDLNVLARWFRQKCSDANITDAYMAYCQNTSASHSGGSDALFNAGWWHGAMYLGDYTSATNEAIAHIRNQPGCAGQAGVMHYATATPNDLEMSTMGFQSS
jgi:hypothetical protein